MLRIRKGLIRLVALAIIQLAIGGLGFGQRAEAQEEYTPQPEELIRWTEAKVAEAMQVLGTGTTLPPPSAEGIANALALFSASPLTGSGMQQPGAGAGGSSTSSGQATGQAPPPITLQLPPHPPESQAPPAQRRPPTEMPNPSVGGAARPPIEPLTIPLPPHPPESQAPWNQRG